MSDTFLLSIGALIFLVVSLVVLDYGYAAFGRWYDRDKADEARRRHEANSRATAEGRPKPARPAGMISHDDPDRLLGLDEVEVSDGRAA